MAISQARESGVQNGRAATAGRRRVAAWLVAAAAAAGVVAVPGGAASARPLPGDNPPPTCRVDVRAARLIGGLAYHLFVIYRGQGRYEYFRGGPGAGAGGSSRASSSSSGSSSSGRRIVTEYGPYKPGTIDYDPEAYSVTVLLGRQACGKNRCFAAEARRIEKLRRVYKSSGPNSNSVARTLLARCHVPVDKPRVNTPGFEQVL
jgi:hypothetical protein